MLEPSSYDDRGWCVNHPHIRLCKKKLLGGWKVILVNCPDCCIENMLRMRGDGIGKARDGSGGSRKYQGGLANATPRSPGDDSKSNSNHGRHPSQDSAQSNMQSISQLMIRTHSHGNGNNIDNNNSDDFSKASEITYGTRTVVVIIRRHSSWIRKQQFYCSWRRMG